jgi:hypothetical protein
MYSMREIYTIHTLVVILVDNFVGTDQLIGQKKHGLQAELTVAEVEEILERRTQQVEDHGVIIALGTIPPHERNANTASKSFVDL